jgi:hypothetical protein
VFIFICLAVAFVAGFKRGFEGSTGAVRQDSSHFLTAGMTPMTGSEIPYQISFPGIDQWQKDTSPAPFDYLYYCDDAYVGIIPESIGLGAPQKACDISRHNLISKASHYSFTPEQPIEIDSHSWLTFDATATIRGIDLEYRYYVYADTNYTFQIITWSVPAVFDHYAPVFDRIAESFKMPQ